MRFVSISIEIIILNSLMDGKNRKYKLSTKHHKVLKTLYSFDKRYFQENQ